MALTNPQYDAIMRMYNERQLRHQREQQEHIRIAYEKIPRLAEIDAEIASLSVRKAKAMLNGDASMDLDLNAAIRDRSQERAALLSMGFSPQETEVALSGYDEQDMRVEDLLGAALKRLGMDA